MAVVPTSDPDINHCLHNVIMSKWVLYVCMFVHGNHHNRNNKKSLTQICSSSRVRSSRPLDPTLSLSHSFPYDRRRPFNGVPFPSINSEHFIQQIRNVPAITTTTTGHDACVYVGLMPGECVVCLSAMDRLICWRFEKFWADTQNGQIDDEFNLGIIYHACSSIKEKLVKIVLLLLF